MGLFQDINSQARRRNLDFLVIGGLAVIFHGYSRDTADLDLFIRKNDRQKWMNLLLALGYSVQTDKDAFVQLSPPKQGAWPVDLMLVQDATFDPIFASGVEVEMYDTKVKIPGLEHLLALKLHALKHGHIGRYAKDFLDVEGMVRANKLDLNSENIRRIFLKYGTVNIYEQISRSASAEPPPT